MYHNSSQKRHWTFASEEQLARLRADANRKFKCKAVANGKVRTREGELSWLQTPEPLRGPPAPPRGLAAHLPSPDCAARGYLLSKQASTLAGAVGTATDE